jgi:hypothetical protein
MKFLVLTVLLAVPGATIVHSSRVSAEPAPCTTYSIEATSDANSAEVFVHLASEPLVGHTVFATFDGVTDATPIVLITDTEGRARVDLPSSATGVRFSTESPMSANCVTEAASDTVVVSDRVGTPVGEVLPPIPPGVVSSDDGPHGPTGTATGPLATTGPWSPVVLVTATLTLVTGWFARRLRGSKSASAPGRFAIDAR